MKFKTFVKIVAVVVAAVVFGLGLMVRSCLNRRADEVAVNKPQPTFSPEPQIAVGSPTIAPTNIPANTDDKKSTLTTAEIRTRIEQFLTANPDRKGEMKLVDALPKERFKVILLRFKAGDAEKFSDNPSQWSQVQLDLDRNGTLDEKWLLKNGHTYKREVLAGDGKTTTSTEYFK